jgi:hypothetical protein
MVKAVIPRSVADLTAAPGFCTLPSGTPIVCIRNAGGKHARPWNLPRHIGPVKHCRWDPHLPDPSGQPYHQNRGAQYWAKSVKGAFAEFFQRQGNPQRGEPPGVINRRRNAPTLVVCSTVADASLVNLCGDYPLRAGFPISALLAGPRERCRQLARILYEAHPHTHGLLYPSALLPQEHCIALWERGTVALPSVPDVHRPLSDPAFDVLVKNLAADLGYVIVPK